MSKPTGDKRPYTVTAYRARFRTSPTGLDGYPEIRSIPEVELLRGYSIAPEPLQRPVTGFYDESGLVYGEPISEGRTGLPEGDR